MKTEENFKFYDPLRGRSISLVELQAADDETQTEVLRNWFYERYEDPAENTPHDSSEGGYVYLWGGPYDAMDILSDNFCEIVRESVIEELVNELGDLSAEWASKPSAEDFDDYVAETIILDSRFHQNFQTAISYIKMLLESNVVVFAEHRFLRLLFANVITALETYLFDAFINTVMSDEKYVRELVKNDKYFKDKKLSLKKLIEKYDSILDPAKEYLLNISWHNLTRAKDLYENALGITFPKDLGELIQAVLTRHDIIHRNGKTPDGNEVNVNKEDVQKLMASVRAFVAEIDKQISVIRGHVVKAE